MIYFTHCKIAGKESVVLLSNLSRLPIFLATADRVIQLHDMLIRQKENAPKNLKGSPKNSKLVHTRSHGVQTISNTSTKHHTSCQTDLVPLISAPSTPTIVEKIVQDTKQIDALQSQLDTCLTQVKKLEKYVQSLTKENKSLNDRLSKSADDLSREKKENDKSIDKLNRKIEDLTNKV